MTTTTTRRGITPGLPTNNGSFKAEEKAEANLSLAQSSTDDAPSWPSVECDYEDRNAKLRNFLELAYPADNPEGQCDPQYLRSAFSPSAIVGQAHRFYDYMEQHNVGADSATREAAFAYAAADTGFSVDAIYDAWLEERPMRAKCSECGTAQEVRLLAAHGKCSDCVGAWVRANTRRR